MLQSWSPSAACSHAQPKPSCVSMSPCTHLKFSDIRCNATVRLVVMFLMWQLFQGWQVRDGVSRGKEGQKVGRQKLCHLLKPKTRNLTLGNFSTGDWLPPGSPPQKQQTKGREISKKLIGPESGWKPYARKRSWAGPEKQKAKNTENKEKRSGGVGPRNRGSELRRRPVSHLGKDYEVGVVHIKPGHLR